ncbi:hypothetical protein CLV59_104100 [Chitinophaga dinghuensis]|uniref:Uncharacterized protein n=1 Tax=Chitinophaga dinghuensis TaxID=1539050 RepID=A0A327W0W1_9BACT|nr:hypothetical protein [Chitinophaga dinghuensis]RAJ81875.1 hypothetical protein CLV59_104100 [Chitinophaga dinghuensis]
MQLKLTVADINYPKLLQYLNEAKSKAYDAATYNFQLAKETMSNVYADCNFEIPATFLEYDSILEATADYHTWKEIVKTVPTNWNFRFPFTNPWGARQYIGFERDNFHLARRRDIYLWNATEEVVHGGENAVTGDCIRLIYKTLLDPISKEEYNNFNKEVRDLYDQNDVMWDLADKLMDEDEQAAVSADELFILGTNRNMIFEVAVCNYLIAEHNIMYYKPYIDNINNMITYGGLCFVFGELCIICKK